MENASLGLLLGRFIRVDRGGPESRMGKLLAVKGDHVVVYNESDGILYYRTEHIKSLSVASRDFSYLSEETDDDESDIPGYFDVEDFMSVLQNMEYHWVQINRGGPEKLEGVLIEATDEAVTMIVGDEVIKVLPFHIRNISYGMKKNNEQSQDNNESNSNEQNNARRGNGRRRR